METSVNTVCLGCGHPHEMKAWSNIDVCSQPELKEKVLSGELFSWKCSECGKLNLVKYPLMYHDSSEKLLLVLSDTALNVADLPEGYTARRVRSVGDLVEKIKIFDAGLDDVVMELCKYVTLTELGKKVELRFLKLEGADNELIFTYPENSQMEMLSVGFNVYEDARGIVSRHPAIKTDGLQLIDADWLSTLLG